MNVAFASPRRAHTPSATSASERTGANEGRGADLADGKVDKGWDFKASVYNRLACLYMSPAAGAPLLTHRLNPKPKP